MRDEFRGTEVPSNYITRVNHIQFIRHFELFESWKSKLYKRFRELENTISSNILSSILTRKHEAETTFHLNTGFQKIRNYVATIQKLVQLFIGTYR